eukprot:Clim_evm79s33 gene=Clim_evmTU79s33
MMSIKCTLATLSLLATVTFTVAAPIRVADQIVAVEPADSVKLEEALKILIPLLTADLDGTLDPNPLVPTVSRRDFVNADPFVAQEALILPISDELSKFLKNPPSVARRAAALFEDDAFAKDFVDPVYFGDDDQKPALDGKFAVAAAELTRRSAAAIADDVIDKDTTSDVEVDKILLDVIAAVQAAEFVAIRGGAV